MTTVVENDIIFLIITCLLYTSNKIENGEMNKGEVSHLYFDANLQFLSLIHILTVSLGIVIDEHKASFEVEPFNEAAAVIKCNSKDDWKKYSVTFTADEELESDGSGLIVTNTGDSDLDVDMVSLMPEDTYKGHGLRKDLMEQLEAMQMCIRDRPLTASVISF